MNRASVSLEIFVPNGEGSDEARIAFVAASRRSAVLNGPHTSKVLHAGVTPDGHPFVAREPAPMRTLGQLLSERSALDTAEAVDIVVALCDALGEAHGHGILHGAIEPRNIRVSPTEIKLMDFETGAIFVDMAMDPFARLVMRAPEQLRIGGRIDERTDIFALGALLFTMIAGASPFAADSPSATALALNEDDPAFLAGVEEPLAELVERCLRRDPIDRPLDVATVAEAIAPFASPRSAEALARIRERADVLSSPTVIVRAQEYSALSQERQSAAPPASSAEIELDWNDLESVTPITESGSASIKPVAMDIGPISKEIRDEVAAMKPRTPFRVVGIAIGLAAGIAIGALSEQFLQNTSNDSVATATTSIEPQPESTGLVETTSAPLAAAATATGTATAEAPKPTPAPSALPKPAAPPAWMTAPAPAKVEPKPAAKIETETPVAKPAATAPKENDEDLRHFLEDRR